MANSEILTWNRGGTPPSNMPHFHDQWSTYYIAFVNQKDIVADDWIVTTPIPTDIKSDFMVGTFRAGGSSTLNLTMEYSMLLEHKLKTDETTWQSVTGDKETWTQSAGTNAAPTGDVFKWDIGENGVAPVMRLAYKNETGGTLSALTLAWPLYLLLPKES